MVTFIVGTIISAISLNFTMLMVGRIVQAVGAGIIFPLIGLLVITITTLPFTMLTEMTSLTYLTVAFAVRMIGLSMVMMPATTAGLNVLPNSLIPHGTAMMNTMRQVAASIGTGAFITIMTIAAKDPETFGNSGLIHGVNVSFYWMTAVTFVGFILTLFIQRAEKRDQRIKKYDKLKTINGSFLDMLTFLGYFNAI